MTAPVDAEPLVGTASWLLTKRVRTGKNSNPTQKARCQLPMIAAEEMVGCGPGILLCANLRGGGHADLARFGMTDRTIGLRTGRETGASVIHDKAHGYVRIHPPSEEQTSLRRKREHHT